MCVIVEVEAATLLSSWVNLDCGMRREMIKTEKSTKTEEQIGVNKAEHIQTYSVC